MIQLLVHAATVARQRWRTPRAGDDAGYATETVLIIATLVSLAILVMAIIAIKVIGKANSIDLG